MANESTPKRSERELMTIGEDPNEFRFDFSVYHHHIDIISHHLCGIDTQLLQYHFCATVASVLLPLQLHTDLLEV